MCKQTPNNPQNVCKEYQAYMLSMNYRKLPMKLFFAFLEV